MSQAPRFCMLTGDLYAKNHFGGQRDMRGLRGFSVSAGWVLGRAFSRGISVRFAKRFLSASVLALIWHSEGYQYVVNSMQAIATQDFRKIIYSFLRFH